MTDRKIVDYRIVIPSINSDMDVYCKKVLCAINEGYSPLGAPTIFEKYDGKIILFQAMVKYEEKEGEN